MVIPVTQLSNILINLRMVSKLFNLRINEKKSGILLLNQRFDPLIEPIKDDQSSKVNQFPGAVNQNPNTPPSYTTIPTLPKAVESTPLSNEKSKTNQFPATANQNKNTPKTTEYSNWRVVFCGLIGYYVPQIRHHFLSHSALLFS